MARSVNSASARSILFLGALPNRVWGGGFDEGDALHQAMTIPRAMPSGGRERQVDRPGAARPKHKFLSELYFFLLDSA
jgi:hypothetical protein